MLKIRLTATKAVMNFLGMIGGGGNHTYNINIEMSLKSPNKK